MRKLPPNAREVADGVSLIRLPQPFYGHANAYLLNGEGGHTLIDAGHPVSSSLLIKTIKALGCPPEELTQIIYTHPHVDHFGGGIALTQWTNIRHFALQDALSDVQDYNAFLEKARENNLHRAEPFLSYFQESEVEKTKAFTRRDIEAYCRKYFPEVGKAPRLVPLESGETVKGGGCTLRVIPTPGHYQYHICLYEAKRRFMFSGDIVVGRSTSIRDVNPYVRSLQRLRDLKPTLLFPGHGPVRNHPGRVFLSAIKDVQEKEKVLRKALRGEPKTLPEIVAKVKRGAAMPLVEYLSIARWIFAFLEKLERERRVRWTEKEGRVLYSLP